jgi:hypothetical protein
VTADEVLTTAQRAGIRLFAEGDQLRYRAPKGVLTPELRHALVAHKAALLAVLQEAEEERRDIMGADDVPAAITRAGLDEPLIIGSLCPRCREDGRIAYLYVRREGILWCTRCLRKGAPGCSAMSVWRSVDGKGEP